MTEGKPARSAAEICRRYVLKPAAQKLLRDDQTPGDFFGLLCQNERYRDAVQFAAHLLPKREAVWWGCLCVWEVSRPEPGAATAAALERAVRWVQEPSEANRRAAEQPGKAAGLDSPAGCLAMALFWSGGSMSPPDLPHVPPPPGLTAQTIAAALWQAAVQNGPDQAAVNYRRFLTLAIEVSNGKNRWDRTPPEEGGHARP